MKLPIIQSLWIGAPLSNLEKLCIQSFIDHGHEFHLYTYADIEGIPAGTIVKDANIILPASFIFLDSNNSVAGFSDWFRYKMLYECGGWWVDTDTVCIKPFDFTDEIVIHEYEGGIFHTTPLCFPKGHPMMSKMDQVCRNFKKRDGARFGAVGGWIPLTKMIMQYDLKKYTKPYFYFTDISWYSAMNKCFAAGIRLHPDTYCIHFSNIGMSKVMKDKNAQFDAESLFEQLKQKHKIKQVTNARRITSDELQAAIIEKNIYKSERHTARKKKIPLIIAIALIAAFGLGFII